VRVVQVGGSSLKKKRKKITKRKKTKKKPTNSANLSQMSLANTSQQSFLRTSSHQRHPTHKKKGKMNNGLGTLLCYCALGLGGRIL
jgi:hypothetical protein